MRKQPILAAALLTLLAAFFLTACGAREETAPVPAEPSPPAEVVETQEAPPAPEKSVPPLLASVDFSAFQDTMSPEEWEGLCLYLPVLEEDAAFHWIVGTELTEDALYHKTSEGVQEQGTVTLAEFHKARWAWNSEAPEELVLNRLAVQDVDGDGVPELVMLFEELGWYYLIFHQEGETFYAVEFPIRWFEDLRQNGVYIGSGGAGSSWYYRMSFRDGVFEQQELGHREEWASGGEYELDGEAVTKADFDAWLAENLAAGVTWYAPDGSVIPENT